MTSYLLITKDPSKALETVKSICDTYNIDPLDQTSLSKPTDAKGDSGRKTTKSIGIEDIKKLRQHIFLKPFKSKTKAIIIKDGESLTPEAQNALLKVLEEPPDHTLIILISKSRDAILPTIQSRCAIKEYEEPHIDADVETEKLIAMIGNLSIKDALEFAESLDKKKEHMGEKLTKIIIALHDYLLTAQSVGEQAALAKKLKALHRAHTIIATSNANARLTLETTLLTLTTN